MTPVTNRMYFVPCKHPHIPYGILCRMGNLFFRIVAGRVRLFYLTMQCLPLPSPDKAALHLLLGSIQNRLSLMLPCLDFRQ